MPRMETGRPLTRCRVTIGMRGTRAGDTVLVDLSDPRMRARLDAGYLVALEQEPATPTEGEKMAAGTPVTKVKLVQGGKDVNALVLEDVGGTKLDLAAPNEDGYFVVHPSVPHREPPYEDGDNGNGTWHE